MRAYADAQQRKNSGDPNLNAFAGNEPLDDDSVFDLWFEAHFSVYEDDGDRDGDFGIAYVGADWLLNERLLVGVLAQFDWGSEEVSNKSDVDGNGWMIGPYVSAEIADNVFFDLRAAWGRSENDVTVKLSGIPYSGEFDTERWLAHARLSGSYAYGNWRITPEASLAYMHEERENFTVIGAGGVLPTSIPSKDFSLGKGEIGPEFAYRYETVDGLFEPHFALRYRWDFAVEGDSTLSGIDVYDEGPRGAVEGGIMYRGNSGRTARIAASYDGIFVDDFRAASIEGWLSFPF